MNIDLTQFSVWALALLPRLVIYPGGLWAFAAWLVLRPAVLGIAGFRLRPALRLIARLNLPAALAWTALALVDVPGAAPPAFPADTFVLAGLVISSLVVGWSGLTGDQEQLSAVEISANIALAGVAVAPLTSAQGLLFRGDRAASGEVLAFVAGVAALVVLAPQAARSFPGGIRWLVWLGLISQPFFVQIPDFSPPLLSAVYLGVILVAGAFTYAKSHFKNGSYPLDRAAAAICWVLAVLALLVD